MHLLPFSVFFSSLYIFSLYLLLSSGVDYFYEESADVSYCDKGVKMLQ